MNKAFRNDLLTVLAELSAACPEMRFGQLIANLTTLAGGDSSESLWDIEDEQLLAAAQQQLAYFLEHPRTPTCSSASNAETVGAIN